MLSVVKTDKTAQHIGICPSCATERLVRAGRQNILCWNCSRSKVGKSNTKHGLHKSRIYRIHRAMKQRCGMTNAKHKHSYLYEGRGIKVCEEWTDFNKFAVWAYANGYNDTLEIDRINNELGYNPDNCRWVTHKENMANRRPRSEWKNAKELH
jgi:hypothetical protein